MILEFHFSGAAHIFRAKSIQLPSKNGQYAYESGSNDVAFRYDFYIATVYFAVLVVLFIKLFWWLATWNRH